MPDIGIIVLAAGASVRMGRPKQLLDINGQSLIRHVLGTALQSSCSPIIVVLGKSADLIRKEVSGLPVEVVVNDNWEQGMSTSIRTGIGQLARSAPGLDAVILLLVDQPFVDTDILEKLIRKYSKTNKKIIASEYGDTYGVPALFDHTVFPELLDLQGKAGAKKIIQKYLEQDTTLLVSFPKGQTDLDTPEQYENFRRHL